MLKGYMVRGSLGTPVLSARNLLNNKLAYLESERGTVI